MACISDTVAAENGGGNDSNGSSGNDPEQQQQQELQQQESSSPDGKKPIPRRNLSEAFEALCTTGSDFHELEDDDDDEEDGVNSKAIHLVSPPLSITTTISTETDKNTSQQPALISPTTVTDMMGVNTSSNNSSSAKTVATPTPTTATATPAAATAPLARSVTPPPPPSPAVTTTSTTPALELRSYEFDLHPDLRRELSQALVNRVSFYGIVHDINKEAACMAANDPKPGHGDNMMMMASPLYSSNMMMMHSMDNNGLLLGGGGLKEEKNSPLIQAVMTTTGNESAPSRSGESIVTAATIDEEQWLLDAIQARRAEERSTTATAGGLLNSTLPPVCPPTFSQAMGEKEYEIANPVHALSGGNRTQLWKPSRSWWEAKSGKNPWIEPSSHNKRWRYLWPLIHYHKFLAKCIKKLKRNGVDVKHSVSPVAVFLREEVCAVSDHLKDVSLFGSDEWIACLHKFSGWTDIASEEDLRKLVGTLKLRPLSEPGDVDSPLLRSQIDEHFLRAMEAARAQLRDGPTAVTATTSSTTTGMANNLPDTATKNKLHSQQQQQHKGPPPMYPRQPAAASVYDSATPSHVTQQQSGVRRPRFIPPTPLITGVYGNHPYHHAHQQYWGWEQNHHHASQQQHSQPPPAAYGDNGSVQSALSADSCYGGGGNGYSEYPTHAAPMHYPYYSPAGYVSGGSQYSYEHHHADVSAYHHQQQHPHHHQQQHGGWVDPSMAYAMHGNHAYYGGTPTAPPTPIQTTAEGSQQLPNVRDGGKGALSPVKYGRQPLQPSQSPFWSHLDSCVALGLATPAKSTPSTPRRGGDDEDTTTDDYKEEGEDVVNDCHHYKVMSTEDLAGYSHEEKSSNAFSSMNAQPLLLRQYYGTGYGHYGAHDGYAPPSPATQFMMSPQQNFAYNIGYGLSPGRQGRTPRKRTVMANANHAPPLPMAQKTSTLSPTAPTSSTTHNNTNSLMPPRSVYKGMERVSPSTVGTTTDSSDLDNDHHQAVASTTSH